MIRGLREFYDAGIGPRGLLFVALDEHGDTHVAAAQNADDVATLRVGNKLSLPWPFSGRMFYLDAVHPLSRDTAVINGDRRIGSLSSMVDVAVLVSGFVQRAGAQSIFFGCTPHQPGSWWVKSERAISLHERGFVDLVQAPGGLLARRTVDDGLYFLPLADAVGGAVDRWQRVFDSPLGNVLLIERRVLDGRLVLSCQRGLVEVDVERMPSARETGRIDSLSGYAVVGRVTNGAFAVTSGVPRDWGLDGIRPATLVGSRGCTFTELGELLAAGVGGDDDGEGEELPTGVISPRPQ